MSDETWEDARKVPLNDYKGDCLYVDTDEGEYYFDARDILLGYGEWPEGVYGTIETPIVLDALEIVDGLEQSDAAYEDYEVPDDGVKAIKDFCEQWNEKYGDKSYLPDFNIGIVDGGAE